MLLPFTVNGRMPAARGRVSVAIPNQRNLCVTAQKLRACPKGPAESTALARELPGFCPSSQDRVRLGLKSPGGARLGFGRLFLPIFRRGVRGQ